MKTLRICLDPGHGLGNRRRGVYDAGATVVMGRGQVREADVVMDWVNELRGLLQARGHTVIRTRKDALDPAPISSRAKIANRYRCNVLLSIHCNSYSGQAEGTETFYRGTRNLSLARRCQAAVVNGLGTLDRGLKAEAQSQHAKLAVLGFPSAVLIELAFLDHPGDRARLLDPALMLLTCQNLVTALEAEFT